MPFEIVLCKYYYYTNRKAFINFVQKRRRVLWARIHLRWIQKTVEMCSLVRKRKKTIQTVVQKQASVMVWGCNYAHGMGDLHVKVQQNNAASGKYRTKYLMYNVLNFTRKWNSLLGHWILWVLHLQVDPVANNMTGWKTCEHHSLNP